MRTIVILVSAASVASSVALASAASAVPGASSYVRTQSGKVRCAVVEDDAAHRVGPSVICEALGLRSASSGQYENNGFLQAPAANYGSHWHIAAIDGAGKFHFGDGNINETYPSEDTVLTYGRTVRLAGWTIDPDNRGTRFTNDETGHGMFVSIENAYGF